jgi:hypothetical protein
MITLKTLNTATTQEVFDQVATHMLTQFVKAYSDSFGCMYRSGTLKCAAGCLIADNEYKKRFEHSSWSKLVRDELVPKEHKQLIIALQEIHDYCDEDFWLHELEVKANELKLNFDKEKYERLAKSHGV